MEEKEQRDGYFGTPPPKGSSISGTLIPPRLTTSYVPLGAQLRAHLPPASLKAQSDGFCAPVTTMRWDGLTSSRAEDSSFCLGNRRRLGNGSNSHPRAHPNALKAKGKGRIDFPTRLEEEGITSKPGMWWTAGCGGKTRFPFVLKQQTAEPCPNTGLPNPQVRAGLCLQRGAQQDPQPRAQPPTPAGPERGEEGLGITSLIPPAAADPRGGSKQ